MPHWLALRPHSPRPTDAPAAPPLRRRLAPKVSAQRPRSRDAAASPPAPEALALGWWALQFTPKVALLDEAVLLEVSASLRLFGGAAALHACVARGLAEQAAEAVIAPANDHAPEPAIEFAAGPSSLAALALLRAGRSGWAGPGACQQAGPRSSTPTLLDPLPLHTLSAAAAQAATLQRLGCRTLGQLRALPRAGLSRRLGAELLDALDRCYALQPESHTWLALPEVFKAELELPGRVDAAPALMFGAQRLLAQLGAWLAARHAGVRSIVLSWRHDFGSRHAGQGGELRVRTADNTRRVDHLARLLSEQLARTCLAAPVNVLVLQADAVEPLPETSGLLWRGHGAAAEHAAQGQWTELIERLSARLGPEQVLCPEPQADHRPEAMWRWVPAAGRPAPRTSSSSSSARTKNMNTSTSPIAVITLTSAASATWPQPAWLLPKPQALAMRGERPVYQGPLQMLAGPQRVETGWWDDGIEPSAAAPAQRDYYVAWSTRAGLLSLYRERRPQDGGSTWFLHGFYG